MRYLVVSDMHGNAEALCSVLRAVRRKRFDYSLVLGDLVGYGAEPNQVIELLSDLPGKTVVIRGNHDKVVAGIEDGSGFNDAALHAARWTAAALTVRTMRALRALPIGPLRVTDGLAICHGSPRDEDMYLFSEYDAQIAFQGWATPITFFGHTHLPSLFIQHSAGVRGLLLGGRNGRIRIQSGFRYLLNPGSIGQPRDRNPLAAYMTYDDDKKIVRWYRVPYAIARAQRRIVKAGLPESLANRLAYGM